MFRSKFVVALLMAVFLQALCGLAAHAQTIRFFDTRGREIRSGNPFPYDRFSRGEICNVQVTGMNGCGHYEVISTRGHESGDWWFWNGTSDTFEIPRDTNADNLVVYVRDQWWNIRASKRIPIGSK